LNKYILPSVLCFLLASSGTARADQRVFVWTYQYQTLHSGEAEIEQYTTLTTPSSSQFKDTTSIEHQYEIEIGMTDRFDFSIYQVFGQTPGSSYRYKAFKLRSRYRLGTTGGDWLKPIIYLEYKANQDFSQQDIEFKPIIGMTTGDYIAAINPKLELEIKRDESEFEWGYSAGLSRKLGSLGGIGLELSGSEAGNYFGPTLYHGRSKLWMSLGSGFAIRSVESGKPKIQLRLILGFNVSGDDPEHR
jgi:hypothetical protein